jgi:FkbM family methyltransferase
MNFKKSIVDLFLKAIDIKTAGTLINYIASQKNINLLMHAYHQMGIHKASSEGSGEIWFIERILKDVYRNYPELTFFDIGANVGNYTQMLKNSFNSARIHAFEPLDRNYIHYCAAFKNCNDIFPNKMALGAEESIVTIHSSEGTHHEHATLYKEVLEDLLAKDQFFSEEIRMTTIDSYCIEKNISEIHFIKIDTEGHEFDILKGAQTMLKEGRIKIIQFEFNEMNIVSKIFLKDFYSLLKDFEFYRLDTESLIPLGKYNSMNEIFQFQNLVALAPGLYTSK